MSKAVGSNGGPTARASSKLRETVNLGSDGVGAGLGLGMDGLGLGDVDIFGNPTQDLSASAPAPGTSRRASTSKRQAFGAGGRRGSFTGLDPALTLSKKDKEALAEEKEEKRRKKMEEEEERKRELGRVNGKAVEKDQGEIHFIPDDWRVAIFAFHRVFGIFPAPTSAWRVAESP